MELYAVPNVSEGRDARTIGAIGEAFGVPVLDVHADADHHRTVYWLRGGPGELAPALARGAAAAAERIDLRAARGIHPHVGALDVAPVVFATPAARGAACAEALLAAQLIGDAGLPVFLYGLLAAGRTRAELRAGGLEGLAERGTAPDFGPPAIDPATGAVLVAARPPLVAFNLEIDGSPDDARAVAHEVRKELPSVRTLGLWLDGPRVAQVSCNVEDPSAVPLARLLAAVRRHARVREAELVGLAPRAAFDGWPDDVEIRNRRSLEDAVE